MGIDAKAGFVGLVTSCGEVSAAQGALRVADNVTLRREGALTLRSFFGSTALARQYLGAFPYRAQLWYWGTDGRVYNAAQTALSISMGGSAAMPALVRADVVAMKEARGNLYIATTENVLKVATAADTSLRQSGLSTGSGAITLAAVHSSGTLLAPNQQAGYRAVAKYTDPNGLIIKARPTGAVIAQSGSSSGAGRVDLWFSTTSQAIVPDEIEVYRTRIFPSTVAIDDEYQLVGTVKRSSINYPSVNYFSFIDQVPDAARGQTLYTSPSRGGAENANDRAPGCACLERFRGSLFFGNTVGPHRAVFSWKWPATTPDRTGQATGLGYRTATGNVTNGSTQITSVSNLTGVQVGMSVQYAGIVMGRVEAISGSTVTASSAAGSTAAGAALTFWDAITASAPGFQPATANVKTYNAMFNTSYSFSQAPQFSAYELTPANPGYTETLVLERFARGGSAFTVKASHGDEYDPPLPLYSAATGLSSTNDVFPNGLAWSEPDEPEHVPPKNFARVGDAGKAILALVATRDRLLIMKEDGVFMLTGDVAKNFAIYPLDTTALCILPGSVRRLQNTVYFLSNLGLVAIDENGGTNIISRSIQTELGPIITQIRQTQKTTGTYLMPGLSGVTGTADDPNGEYWMLLGSTTPSFGGQALVYNAFREGFTTYSFGTPAPVAVAENGEGQPLVLTASTLLTPSTSLGAITAKVSPHAFSDPALVGKLWTHIVAGFSRLTGTTSVTAKFSSSESLVDGASATETVLPQPPTVTVEYPGGTLMRHPIPSAMKRAFLTFVELTITVATGTFVLEFFGAESRENIANKPPTHGTGST